MGEGGGEESGRRGDGEIGTMGEGEIGRRNETQLNLSKFIGASVSESVLCPPLPSAKRLPVRLQKTKLQNRQT